MKSKLLVAISALSVVIALPLLAQGQGGGQWGGQGGNWDPEAAKTRMVEGAVEALDTDDDGELSKEEFVEMATNERYSGWFAEADAEDEEESGDDDAEANEEETATADDESEEGDDESEEDALKKLYEAKFAEVDADEDESITVDELTEAFDMDAYWERRRAQWQEGGGNWQRGQGGQGGRGGGRPGGGSP